MTANHIIFDESGHHHLPPHFGPRDSTFDIPAMPMTYPPLDTYIHDYLSASSSFSHAPPPFQFSDFVHDDPGNFGNPWTTSSLPVFDNHLSLQAQQQPLPNPPPQLQEPAPVSPASPQLMYPPQEPVPVQHSQFLDQNAGSNSHILHFPTTQSIFVPSGGKWSQPAPAQSQGPDPIPKPLPSWTMSGSLDPNTGIYQRAPEHPRVRTAQACEKCRTRKAKCSGEHPTCQRCSNRGLTCEYAPERKMRGPNKVKRKSGAAVSGAASRRASVVSSASAESSSDEAASSSLSSKPSLTVIAQKSTLEISSAPTFSVPSPTNSMSASSEVSHEELADGSSRLQRFRPPPLNLKRMSMVDLQSQFVNHAHTLANKEVGSHSDSEIAASRRSSLPSYLLKSYSRIAQNTQAAPSGLQADLTQRPFSTQPQSSFPLSGSSSESLFPPSMSTPITPITLNTSNSIPHSLILPPNFLHTGFVGSPASLDPHVAHMAAIESQYGVTGAMANENAWVSSMLDLDQTPTASSVPMEQNLAQAQEESQMLVDEPRL